MGIYDEQLNAIARQREANAAEAAAGPLAPLEGVSLKLRGHDGTEIEIPLDQLFARATLEARRGRPAPRTMKCLNCSQQLPFTGHAETDHHVMMRHHVEDCPESPAARREQRLLLEEFQEQPRQTAKRLWKFWRR
jgi:hypothetical protein